MAKDFIKHGKLTEQELYHVLRELSRYKQKARTAGIYSSTKGKYLDKDKRSARVCWATTDIAPYTFNIMQSHVVEQYSQYPLDTTEQAEIQYTRYDVGGVFAWHQDNIQNHRKDGKKRGITMSLNLSDPSSYAGGNLLVRSKDKEVALSKERGSYIMFPSFLKHQACRVDSGIREALVVWTYLTIEEMDWFAKQCEV